MKCAIMQPTFLPWAGYFNLISSADVFVFLDDVQFSKRSWQQRNRICLNGREHFLTIPVLSKGKQDQLIFEVQTDENQKWRKSHLSALTHAYSNHTFGKQIIELVGGVLSKNNTFLADINMEIITAITFELGLKTEIKQSSKIPVEGKKSEYLRNICHYLSATSYLSAAGSKEYIEEEGVFQDSSIQVEYQHFVPEVYEQKSTTSFIPYLTVIDLIANCGFRDACKYIG